MAAIYLNLSTFHKLLKGLNIYETNSCFHLTFRVEIYNTLILKFFILNVNGLKVPKMQTLEIFATQITPGNHKTKGL